MNDLARLILTLALAGTAVTFLGSFVLWLTNEDRRIGGALKRVLGGPSEATLIARGRGRGAGLSVSTGLFATVWDKGAWCMVYRLDEVTGGEIIVDGEVVARVFRGEPRKALERVPATAREVMLRLVFDDPRYPDFELELWAYGDETLREAPSAARCAQEANQWLARIESLVRRPRQPVVAASPPPPQARPPKVSQRPPPSPAPLEEDEPPPWDDDDPGPEPDDRDREDDLFDHDYDDPDRHN
jgi:hypothetical protein